MHSFPFELGQHVRINGSEVVGYIFVHSKNKDGAYVRFEHRVDSEQFFEWWELTDATGLPVGGSPKSLQRVRIKADGRIGTVYSLRAGGVRVQLKDDRGSFDWSEVEVI